jgi:hypothetical protein
LAADGALCSSTPLPSSISAMTADIAEPARTMLVDSLVMVSTSAAAAATTVIIAAAKAAFGFASHAQNSGYGADDRGGDGHDVGCGFAGEILGGDSRSARPDTHIPRGDHSIRR